MATAPTPFRDLDWEPARARAFGERALELWERLLEELPSLPVTHETTSGAVRDAVALEIPEEPLGDGALAEHLRELLFDQSVYSGHPGFLAYVLGSGTAPGAVAELLSGALNANTGGWRIAPGPVEVEQHLTRWLAARFGLPATAGGQMVTGGATANLTALKAARDAALGPDTRERGVRGARAAIYATQETHAVIGRAADILGLGSDAVRQVPVDDALRMRIDALEEMLAADLAAGVLPLAVAGTAGTTATGAIDPLPEIADVCERRAIWMHVDAAYGGGAILTDELAPLLAGIERADTIAVDPHKWMYVPFACGCVLVRDLQRFVDSFAVSPTYIWQDDEATSRGGVDPAQLGIDFSRGFNALKVWLSLLAHGRRAYGRRIAHDAALARYLGELVSEREDFELMAPVTLSVCCFRHVPAGWTDDERIDRHNERLMTAVQADGRVYCSNAVLGGRFALRACITNFRTEAEHLELLVGVAAELGERLASGAQAISHVADE